MSVTISLTLASRAVFVLVSAVACSSASSTDPANADRASAGGRTTSIAGSASTSSNAGGSTSTSQLSGGTSGAGKAPSLGGAITAAGGNSSVGGAAHGGTPIASSGGAANGGTAITSGSGAAAGGATVASGGTANRGGATNAGGGLANSGGVAASAGGAAKGGGTSSGAGASAAAAGGRASSGGSTSGCTTFAVPAIVGTLQASGLTELSGMVASRDQANTLYAHADSGGAAKIFVFNAAGTTLGAVTLTGATATDWEDISIGVVAGGADYVYVADIGDNASRTGTGTPRTSIAVYRFLEPAVGSLSASSALAIADWQVAKLTYPSATHDAETLFADPLTQDIILVTKDTNGQSLVYRAPTTAFGSASGTVLEQVGQLTVGASGQQSALITAGDISFNGDRVILRTYTAILLFPRLTTWAQTFAATPVTLPSASETQGEGLTFNADATAWYSAGEQSSSIYQGVDSCP